MSVLFLSVPSCTIMYSSLPFLNHVLFEIMCVCDALFSSLNLHHLCRVSEVSKVRLLSARAGVLELES